MEDKPIIFPTEDENEELVPLLTTKRIKTEIGSEGKDIQGKNTDLFKSVDENGYNGGNMAPIDESGTENTSQRPPLTNPTIDLQHRILGLSQKGDWDACEVTLRMLEKETAEEHNDKPLEKVTDDVINTLISLFRERYGKNLLRRLQNYTFSGNRKYSSDVCSNGKQIDYSATDDKDGVRYQCGK